MTLSEAAIRRMQAWSAANPQNKNGRHHYRLEDYGLTHSGIMETFSAYEAFNDSLEVAWGYR